MMEELAKANKSAPSKDSSQRSSQRSDSPNGQKRVVKPSKREDTIHVESNNKAQRESLLVTLKYKKRISKNVERLLALPPTSAHAKKKSDQLKKDVRATRDRSDSLEPGTARKRPIPAADTSEASKRPRTSETVRPSTPPRQSSAMTRVASNNSQAGTPGLTNGLTPRRNLPNDVARLWIRKSCRDYIQGLQVSSSLPQS